MSLEFEHETRVFPERAAVAEAAEQPKENRQASTESEDVGPEGFGHRPILVTTIICALAAAAGHGLIWVAAASGRGTPIYWQPVVGISICIVGIAAFGGFYLASRRARIAIAVSFLMVFFLLFSYVLTISGLQRTLNGGDPDAANIAKDLINDFRWIVITIIAFYFGSETAVSITKVKNVAQIQGVTPAEIYRADRDLPATKK